MALRRMDNVEIIVDDLEGMIAFLEELGMELEGKALLEEAWAARVVGFEEQSIDVAMMRTPDGHGRIELAKYNRPAAISGVPEDAPANTLGLRRIMFAVDDLDDTVTRLRTHGAELVGEVAQVGDNYRLCYLRGPEGVVIALAEELA
ncbi:VOC family protein [Kribbella sp. CA-247076]|uniref:VOC family protein n=1 Tax=Kribbella sp. CA-247076 TaxID=3239941 RepID=UPI003D8AB4E4